MQEAVLQVKTYQTLTFCAGPWNLHVSQETAKFISTSYLNILKLGM